MTAISQQNPSSSAFSGDLTGQAKLDEVTRLLENLHADLDKISLLPHQRDAALEQLKIYGRNPESADPIFTAEGIETLTRIAFNSPSYTTSRNALRCLANALLLKAPTRQIFVNLEYEAKICARLKNDNRDDEFLVSRIIFLTTYDSTMNLENMIDQHHLAENINHNIAKHAKHYPSKQKKTNTEPMEDMALIETLKLLFNITHFCPQRSAAFTPAVSHILNILLRRPLLPNQPLEPPIGPLINALINLNLENKKSTTDPSSSSSSTSTSTSTSSSTSYSSSSSSAAASALFPRSEPGVYVEHMIAILELAVRAYNEDELDQQGTPLLTLMRRVYEAAAPSRDVRRLMRARLLPSDRDRDQPLGRSESLASRLLRLSTSPAAPRLRDAISALLFDISERDAATFVRNVGYGFASGFLFQHNLAVPETALEAFGARRGSADSAAPERDAAGQRLPPARRRGSSSAATTGSEASAGGTGGGSGSSRSARKMREINPITGQAREAEPKIDMPEMSRAEKEREAERLMVLFERLKKSGIMKVQNPMEKAQHEGQFEELSSDAESE